MVHSQTVTPKNPEIRNQLDTGIRPKKSSKKLHLIITCGPSRGQWRRRTRSCCPRWWCSWTWGDTCQRPRPGLKSLTVVSGVTAGSIKICLRTDLWHFWRRGSCRKGRDRSTKGRDPSGPSLRTSLGSSSTATGKSSPGSSQCHLEPCPGWEAGRWRPPAASGQTGTSCGAFPSCKSAEPD